VNGIGHITSMRSDTTLRSALSGRLQRASDGKKLTLHRPNRDMLAHARHSVVVLSTPALMGDLHNKAVCLVHARGLEYYLEEGRRSANQYAG
jgi:hypothetical protein